MTIPLKGALGRPFIFNMSSLNMQTNRPTNADALDAADPTAPPMSTNRYNACAWYCRMMAESAPASDDGLRFLAGLEVS